MATYELTNRLMGGKLRQKLISWRREGLTMTECAKRLDGECGVRVSREMVRRWLLRIDANLTRPKSKRSPS